MWFIFALLSAVFASLAFILAFIFLHENFTLKSLIGCILIGAGTMILVV